MLSPDFMNGKGVRYLPIIAVLVFVNACSLDSLVRVDDPEVGREIDRSAINSYSGALGVHHSSLASFNSALDHISRDVGTLTDELQTVSTAECPFTCGSQGRPEMDSRTEVMISDRLGLAGSSYLHLQRARVRASQASDLLGRYGPESSLPVRSHSYAVEAFTVVLLAEQYCSGVPLTEMPFEGELIYTDGYSTNELLERSLVLFDSALELVHDSTPLLTFARVGKGRALLNLGRYAEAEAAVADVNVNDRYSIGYTSSSPSGSALTFPFWTGSISGNDPLLSYRITNFEGRNGIEWMASHPRLQDPRVPVSTQVRTVGGNALDTVFTAIPRQQKFTGTDLTISFADGIHALMIRAEAQLNNADGAPDAWLNTLNEARRTIGLTDTTDPGDWDARVDLLFRERAFWFYLTGTRLGDMRRMVRQYGRSPYDVYPSGIYSQQTSLGGSYSQYGEAYVFSPPENEFMNYQYSGCINKHP